MKKIGVLIFIIMIAGKILGQTTNTTCATAAPFCTNTTYSFPMATGTSAETGPNYACLCSQPNPVWYYMLIDQPGNLIVHIYSPTGNDVDFVCYGPYNTLTGACNQLTAACSGCGIGCPDNTEDPSFYPSGNVVDCSYDPSSDEYLHIYNAQTGQYYILCITNFSDEPGNLVFQKTGGTATTNCAIVTCHIDNFTATPGTCDPTTNTYSLTGSVSFGGQPTTGQLIVKDNSGPQVSYNAPFTSPQNFTLSGITADGQQHYVVVYFTGAPTCKDTIYYTAPASCTNTPTCDVHAGPDTTINCGASVQLWASGADTYQWSPASSLSNPNIPNPVATPSMTTTYTVTGTVTATGCTDTAQVTVVVLSGPTINSYTSQSEHCNKHDGSVVIQVSGGTPPYSYLWSNGAVTDTLIGVSAGNYSVTVTDQNGCQTSGTYQVNSISGPIASFTAHPQRATTDDPVITFINQAVGGTQCLWDFGDQTTSQNCQNPIHTYPSAEGEYHVTLTVCDDYGCCDSTSGVVYIESLVSIYIPDAFSPNEDGINDYFYISASGINPDYFELYIYDRWGNMVFHTTDINQPWDGKYKGKYVPSGCYVYKMKYTDRKNNYLYKYGQLCVFY
jgi:gliding motility-associated-like protein